MVNPRTDTELSLRWMREGTGFVVGLVDKLTDAELREPSGLPGWTRAHVVAHLARNAEGIGRLARWARTGVETPMYASPHQRNVDIDLSVRHDVPTLRAELTDTAAALAREISLLDERAWAATVRSAQGGDVPATVIPWMRAREVWLHGIDLDAGGTPADLPSDLVDAMLRDIAADMATKPGCPAVTLTPEDTASGTDARSAGSPLGVDARSAGAPLGVDARSAGAPLGAVALGPGGPPVYGAAPDLLAWLIGRPGAAPLRTDAPDGVPEMPRWL